MRLESGSHSPFRRPIKEDQPIDPQHRGPVVRPLLVSPLMPSHRRLLSRHGCTSTRRMPQALHECDTMHPQTQIACSRAECGSSTCGVPSLIPSRTTRSPSRIGALSNQRRTSFRHGTSIWTGRELRSACVTTFRTIGTTWAGRRRRKLR